jgi:hypothetical protein
MKFVEHHPFADPDAAARRLVEIANAVEAMQDGRIYIELINGPFLDEGGTPDQFRAALARAITLGWLWRHESGTLCEVHGGWRGPLRVVAHVAIKAVEPKAEPYLNPKLYRRGC